MTWLALAAFGGLVGLDATSFAQTMISRPLIAATITGLILGRPADALLLAALLELFALVILPVGAARYPEAGTAAVAATAAALTVSPIVSPSILLLAVLFSLLWEHVGGMSVVLGRRFNERYATLDGVPASHQLDRLLERRQLLTMGVDFLRAAAVTLVGVWLGSLAIRGLSQMWVLDVVVAPAILSIGVACMVAAALPLFGGLRAQKRAFGLGLACGLLILLLR
jgi:PTS system mannose-specific IIC component